MHAETPGEAFDPTAMDPDFVAGDVFDPFDGGDDFGGAAGELDPRDEACAVDDVITPPGGADGLAPPPLTVRRPTDDAVLEALIHAFQREAAADPGAYDAVMQARLTAAVRDRPRGWYWSKVWPSAVALARWLATEEGQEAVRGKEVLDLGCGVGTAGLAAALYGQPAAVTLVDSEPRALAYARFSAEANRLGGVVAADVVDWGRPPEGAERGRYGVVLVSDVLYDAEAVAPVAAYAGAALAPGGIIVVADQRDRPYDAPARLRALADGVGEAARGACRVEVLAGEEEAVEWDGRTHRVAVSLVKLVDGGSDAA